MTDGAIVAIASVVSTFIGGVVTISTLFINKWFNRQEAKLNKQEEKLDALHKDVNGKMEKLLESKDAESLAKQRVAASTGHVTDAPPEKYEPLR